jgi:hypothetical protein
MVHISLISVASLFHNHSVQRLYNLKLILSGAFVKHKQRKLNKLNMLLNMIEQLTSKLKIYTAFSYARLLRLDSRLSKILLLA